MKKYDLMRPYEEITDLMSQFFDRNLHAHKSFSIIKVDVQEKDNAYLVTADLPGVKKEDIHLDLIDNYLVIDVTQKQESEKEDKSYVRKERSYLSAKRTIYLAHPLKEGIDAKLNEGVLSITIPKGTEQANKKGIEIK